ncbi:unnamed protein product [Cylindrotheca closterium]|uniref:Ankyrin repeat protein n=1 Tax=Cylindrotheca closterium TaxID=2856 RepID=A0AAD2D0K3_9STRA|nr:unnamed protein product [Cylindrotheca closterium]
MLEVGETMDSSRVVRNDNAAFCSTMNVFQNMFSCGSPATYTRSQLRQIDECDYDKNPTRLYKAIENLNWASVLDFLLEGTWQDSGFEKIFPETDANPPAKQAGMWVTKFDEDGKVEWSRIPLHAAVINGAPYTIVKRLMDLFPEGIRCTDDKGMLPLHLAIKHSSTANILRLLLEKFPEAMFAKDNTGNGPFQMKEDERTRIMTIITNYTTKRIQEECGQIEQKRLQTLQNDLAKQREANEELEAKLTLKNQVIVQSTKEKEQTLRQLAKYQQSPQSLPLLLSSNASDEVFNALEGTQRRIQDLEYRMRNNNHHHSFESSQVQNEMAETSAINRLDRELRAEKRRLEEKNRMNRQLRGEKEKLEDELRRSKQQVRRITKERMTDDLKYCQQKMEELDKGAAHNGFSHQMKQEDPIGLQERDEVEDFREEDDLERRIRQSQETVSRLLQRSKGGPRSRSSRDRQLLRNQKYGHARHSDEVSEMTPVSFSGRSTEDVRGGLHKMMKNNLMQKETGIRDRISRMRHYHV